MLDRFKKERFDLGWFIPNYGVEKVDPQAISSFNNYRYKQMEFC